jgi:hypothetical protein
VQGETPVETISLVTIDQEANDLLVRPHTQPQAFNGNRSRPVYVFTYGLPGMHFACETIAACRELHVTLRLLFRVPEEIRLQCVFDSCPFLSSSMPEMLWHVTQCTGALEPDRPPEANAIHDLYIPPAFFVNAKSRRLLEYTAIHLDSPVDLLDPKALPTYNGDNARHRTSA